LDRVSGELRLVVGAAEVKRGAKVQAGGAGRVDPELDGNQDFGDERFVLRGVGVEDQEFGISGFDRCGDFDGLREWGPYEPVVTRAVRLVSIPVVFVVRCPGYLFFGPLRWVVRLHLPAGDGQAESDE